MLSRRNIRIKVLQNLYAYKQQEAQSIPVFQKALEHQFKTFYQFYYFNLLFLDDFNHFLESERSIESEKYFPNKQVIRNTQFLDRLSFYQTMVKDPDFEQFTAKLPFDWKKYGELFNRLFIDLVQYDFFIDYSVFDEPTPEIQKAFLTNLYEFLFNEFDLFSQNMEDEYICWDDDSADVLKAIVSTVNQFYDQKKFKIEGIQSKQKEDIQFGLDLFEKAIVNQSLLDELIHENTSNWDAERLTINDVIMLRMALVEFMYFETIPPKVTINEYLDIAKAYSTPKSHLFLNGVLDKIRITLTQSGQINKSGRGLKNE
jgi:N utilization substance protein B